MNESNVLAVFFHMTVTYIFKVCGAQDKLHILFLTFHLKILFYKNMLDEKIIQICTMTQICISGNFKVEKSLCRIVY